MKDYDQERKDARPDDAPQQKFSAKPVDVKVAEGALQQNVSLTKTDAGGDARPDMLHHEHLSHPANAGQLADILSGLQQSYGNAYVQRVVSELSDEKSNAGSRPQNIRGLDAGTRSEMESILGEDFGDVEVHTGKHAAEVSEELGARAFTRGRDIYFNEGEYDPSTQDGKQLLAHELTHVIQQRGSTHGAEANIVGVTGDHFEREADEMAAAVSHGGHHHIQRRADAPAIQRDEKPKKDVAPTIKFHGVEITPDKPTGTIDADGRFAVAYAYSIVKDAQFIPLTLAVPEGVAVNVTPISYISEGLYSVQNVGGTSARAVVISANYHLVHPPVFQVALTKGAFTYIVVFHFPTSGPPKEEIKKETGK